MTHEQIKHSIITGELKLGIWEKITHYLVVCFILIVPIIILFFHLKDYFAGTPEPFKQEEIWFFVIPVILGFIFYRLQRSRLKFKIIETSLTRDEVDAIIRRVGSELKWVRYISNKQIYLARTHPSSFSGSWGEQITRLFDENKVLVNSICDPNKRSSLVSMGRNRRNVRVLIEEIENAS